MHSARSVLIVMVAGASVMAQPLTREAQERFLATARIISSTPLSQGITKTTRITLTDGKTTHDGHVQTVDVFKPVYRTKEFETQDENTVFGALNLGYRF